MKLNLSNKALLVVLTMALAPAASACIASEEQVDGLEDTADGTAVEALAGSCSYNSIQVRVQPNINTPWTPTLTIPAGQLFRVGGFYNGTGLLAPNGAIPLVVTGPGGFWSAPANGTYLQAPLAGTYTVSGSCGALSETAIVTAKPTSVSATVSGYRSNVGAPQSWWVDTGIDVVSGKGLTFACNSARVYPWAGHAGSTCAGEALLWSDALVPACLFNSLVAKVGQAGTPFCVGSSASTFTAPATGRLYLAPNDGVSFEDNSGAWMVTVGLQ